MLELKHSSALLMKKNCVRILTASVPSKPRKSARALLLDGPSPNASGTAKPRPLLLGTVKLPSKEHMATYTMMLDVPWAGATHTMRMISSRTTTRAYVTNTAGQQEKPRVILGAGVEKLYYTLTIVLFTVCKVYKCILVFNGLLKSFWTQQISQMRKCIYTYTYIMLV